MTFWDILLFISILLTIAAVALGIRYAWKRRCPACGRWLALKRVQQEALDERHQLETEVCKTCGFTRRRIDKA